jgi:branched-chain amino acid aminotransferase
MAITAPLLWLDGDLVPTKDASVPLMGHAAQRGSLVFDVGPFHGTSRGPAIFRARDNAARFLRSARIVGLELPFDEDALVRAAVQVVAENKLEDGLIRWSAFFAATEADVIPRERKTHVGVAAQAHGEPPRTEPMRVSIFPDARKAAPEAIPPTAKVAAAYLGPMIARQRAVAAGAEEVVLLDVDGDIAEAPTANAFAVVGGTLWTPPLGRVLPGITRNTVLTVAKAMGIPVREERLPLEAFTTADEAFLTSVSLPLGPIGWVNGRELGKAPGPITTKLLDRLNAARRGQIPEHESWLTFVR